MASYIGIDLGTSSVKLLLVREDGQILKSASCSYPLYLPHPGWSEQDPEDWWNGVKTALHQLLDGTDTADIEGIGCAGQMHGSVILDENDKVIRPALLWNDGRTAEEADWLNKSIGRDKLFACTANHAFTGFTAPKLLWIRRHEPENFARIRKLMLPGDYISYQLTGVTSCNYCDSSGMLLMDVAHKCWSDPMLEICHISREQLPELRESSDVIGCIKPELAEEFGLKPSVKVVAGAGDNAAAAIGTGTLGAGACNISLGTSGTVFIASDSFDAEPNGSLHAFAHADGKWHLFGTILCGASCYKWFCEDILNAEDLAAEQKDIRDDQLGRNELFFLPYLMGERTPVNDIGARASFVGMSMSTTRSDMIQAVLEGVAFAIRDAMEAAGEPGGAVKRSKICGGGARSSLWQKIFANVLNIPIDIPQAEEGPGFGAAMLAMVGCGAYGSIEECADALCRTKATVLPDPETAARYAERYRVYQEIAAALRPVFPRLKQ